MGPGAVNTTAKSDDQQHRRQDEQQRDCANHNIESAFRGIADAALPISPKPSHVHHGGHHVENIIFVGKPVYGAYWVC